VKGIRLGLLARSDHRGISNQSRALYRWLRPMKTLHIHMTSEHGSWSPFPDNDAWYPDARITEFNGYTGQLGDDAMRWLLQDIDVVLAVETPHDYRLWEWAREAGVRTVVVANPEFYRHSLEPDLPPPDLVIRPSPWRSAEIPGVTLPHPVDRIEFPFHPRPLDPGRVRFLHVIGHKAIWDRAGTDIVMDALWRTEHPIDLTIRSQEPLPAPVDLRIRQLRYNRRPKVLTGDLEEPAALYRGFDVLVAPRRYGGLSLPLNEAASCGLAVIATNRVPENLILPPEVLVPVGVTIPRRFQGGILPMECADPIALIRALARLAADPGLVASLSAASDAYAESISWPALLARWESLLASVMEREEAAL